MLQTGIKGTGEALVTEELSAAALSLPPRSGTKRERSGRAPTSASSWIARSSWRKQMQDDWTRARDDLVATVAALGFPAELGEAAARHLGSPKAMERMRKYLLYVRPDRAELVVDEMLSIREEIDAWKRKKQSRQ